MEVKKTERIQELPVFGEGQAGLKVAGVRIVWLKHDSWGPAQLPFFSFYFGRVGGSGHRSRK